MGFKAFLGHMIGVYSFENYRHVGIKSIKAKGLRKAFLKAKKREIGYRRALEIEN